MQWMDKRVRITQEQMDFNTIQGVLCNIIMTDGILSRFLKTRHWFAIRKVCSTHGHNPFFTVSCCRFMGFATILIPNYHHPSHLLVILNVINFFNNSLIQVNVNSFSS